MHIAKRRDKEKKLMAFIYNFIFYFN